MTVTEHVLYLLGFPPSEAFTTMTNVDAWLRGRAPETVTFPSTTYTGVFATGMFVIVNSAGRSWVVKSIMLYDTSPNTPTSPSRACVMAITVPTGVSSLTFAVYDGERNVGVRRLTWVSALFKRLTDESFAIYEIPQL